LFDMLENTQENLRRLLQGGKQWYPYLNTKTYSTEIA
jgi:hypothetical protein